MKKDINPVVQMFADKFTLGYFSIQDTNKRFDELISFISVHDDLFKVIINTNEMIIKKIDWLISKTIMRSTDVSILPIVNSLKLFLEGKIDFQRLNILVDGIWSLNEDDWALFISIKNGLKLGKSQSNNFLAIAKNNSYVMMDEKIALSAEKLLFNNLVNLVGNVIQTRAGLELDRTIARINPLFNIKELFPLKDMKLLSFDDVVMKFTDGMDKPDGYMIKDETSHPIKAMIDKNDFGSI